MSIFKKILIENKSFSQVLLEKGQKGIPESTLFRLKAKWQLFATIKKVLDSKVPEGRK